MVAVHQVVLPFPEFPTKSTHKVDLISQRGRRMDDPRSERFCLGFELPLLANDAVKRPVESRASTCTMAKHPHQPVLDRTLVKTFDNVKDFQVFAARLASKNQCTRSETKRIFLKLLGRGFPVDTSERPRL